MAITERIVDYSKGDNLRHYWRLFEKRNRATNKFVVYFLTFRLSRIAHKHGGYIGNGAELEDIPSLPHGLHGVYISRYASVGAGCRIYQNVTIGEVGGKAPRVGNGCVIGAGAILVGNINIGSNVKIGAGVVVSHNVPDGCTVVSQPPRIIRGCDIDV